MVLLRHELPDGSWHFDWLIERRAGEERLLTFRLAVRVDEWDGVVEASRLEDHRRDYLDYQGEVSRGRGRVLRIAEGEVRTVELSETTVTISGRWGDAEGIWRGRAEGKIWRFEVSAPVE